MNAITWVRDSDYSAGGGATAVVDIDGYRISLDERSPSEGRQEYGKATRVYGAIDALVPELAAEEPYKGIHIPVPADAENAVDRMRSKVWRAWRNATTGEAGQRLEVLLGKLYEYDGVVLPVDAAKLRSRFSQNAGCSMCPCSPGMVLDCGIRSEAGHPVDVWVDRIGDWQVDVVRGYGDDERRVIDAGVRRGVTKGEAEAWAREQFQPVEGRRIKVTAA